MGLEKQGNGTIEVLDAPGTWAWPKHVLDQALSASEVSRPADSSTKYTAERAKRLKTTALTVGSIADKPSHAVPSKLYADVGQIIEQGGRTSTNKSDFHGTLPPIIRLGSSAPYLQNEPRYRQLMTRKLCAERWGERVDQNGHPEKTTKVRRQSH